jgi:hypothetical protein
MNVRLDIQDSLLSRYGDTLESEAKRVVLGFTQASVTPPKALDFVVLHQRTSSALFFILVACRTEGKERLTTGTRSKASRMIRVWNRPISTTVRPVLSIPASHLPHLWLQLDPSFRREYINDRLSLPCFWNWIDRTPKASDLVCSLAEHLARNWDSSEKAWEYVEALLKEVPRE